MEADERGKLLLPYLTFQVQKNQTIDKVKEIERNVLTLQL